jgi:hypothetical protein
MVQDVPIPVLQTGMPNDILTSLRRLSDGELVTRLKGLVARDRELTAQIVAHLAELDTRDVFLREATVRSSPTVGSPWVSRKRRRKTGSRLPAPRAAFP